MVLLLAALVFVVIAGTYALVRSFRGPFETVFPPLLTIFNIIRLLAVGIIIYGLLISGRPGPQLLGLGLIALGVIYATIERPHERIRDRLTR